MDVILPDQIYGHIGGIIPELWAVGKRYIVLASRGLYRLKAEERQDKSSNPYYPEQS